MFIVLTAVNQIANTKQTKQNFNSGKVVLETKVVLALSRRRTRSGGVVRGGRHFAGVNGLLTECIKRGHNNMSGLQDEVLHPVPRGCGGQEEWVGARTPANDLPSARSMLRRICSASVCLERPVRSQTLRVGGPTPARHALGCIGAVAGRALRAPQTGPERPAINPRYRPRAWLQPSPGPLLTTHHLLA